MQKTLFVPVSLPRTARAQRRVCVSKKYLCVNANKIPTRLNRCYYGNVNPRHVNPKMQESEMNCFFARPACRMVFGAGIAALSLAAAYADEEKGPFIPRIILSSTIPANGDLNPYGLAFVPDGLAPGGTIAPGDVLVSNFNDLNNCQGKGTTIIKLTPNSAVAPAVSPGSSGNALTFFAGQEPGLTLALGVLRRGFVIVGNVLTTDCMSDTVAGGKLQVVDRNGKLVAARSEERRVGKECRSRCSPYP